MLERKDDRQRGFEEVKPNLMLAAAQQEESEVLNQKVQALVEQASIEVLADFGDEPSAEAEGQAG